MSEEAETEVSFSMLTEEYMTEQFDIVIDGAGHNSLITAAYLGMAGYSCLVLEARSIIGGDI